jgi:hypothetical protein
MSSCLGFFRFIVCMISTMSARPAWVLCRPAAISLTHDANVSKSSCFRRTQRMLLEERRRSARGDPVAASLSSGRGVRGGCHTTGLTYTSLLRRTRATPLNTGRCSRPALRQSRARPGSRSCSLFDQCDLVDARVRSRSILLRLQNRSPKHGIRSGFPADFPRPSHCHSRRRIGRQE